MYPQVVLRRIGAVEAGKSQLPDPSLPLFLSG